MKKNLFALALVSFSALAANTQTQACMGNDSAGCKNYCEKDLKGVYTASQSNNGSCTWSGTAAWNFPSKGTKLNNNTKN